MGYIEILCYDNHLLKYHDYCKYGNIHSVGYKRVVELRSQVCGNFLMHVK